MLYWPVTESAVSHLSLAPSSSLSAVLGGGHLGTSCQKPWNSIFWRNKAKAVLCLCLCVNLTEGFSNKRGEVFSAAETSSGLGSGGDAALSWLITGAIELWNVLLGLSRPFGSNVLLGTKGLLKGLGFCRSKTVWDLQRQPSHLAKCCSCWMERSIAEFTASFCVVAAPSRPPPQPLPL